MKVFEIFLYPVLPFGTVLTLIYKLKRYNQKNAQTYMTKMTLQHWLKSKTVS
jgi:hypothetical protein